MNRASEFVEELKRRRVFRVAAMYALAAWILLQLAEITFEPLGFPETSLRTLILVLALGFPLAAITRGQRTQRCRMAERWRSARMRRGAERGRVGSDRVD